MLKQIYGRLYYSIGNKQCTLDNTILIPMSFNAENIVRCPQSQTDIK